MDKIKYAVMGPQEITAKQQEIIRSIQSVLSVSSDTATLLLRHFKWSENRIHEEWFQDEDKVREKVGLLPRDAEELAEQVKQCSVVDSENQNEVGEHHICIYTRRTPISHSHTSMPFAP